MQKILVLIIFVLLTTIFALGFFIFQDQFRNENSEIMISQKETPKPLLAYTFENLRDTNYPASEIVLGDIIEETDEYTQRKFFYTIPSRPNESEASKVSGLITLPTTAGEYPVIVMYRGYIPEESFVSGAGTSPSAIELARNGYITIAPDFLGFGESDAASEEVFEDRFQTYTTSLVLLESLENFKKALEVEYTSISPDLEKIGIWGHSNGGHIALATLSISGAEYPTVLWAPVSKSFPYSILYYTDETDDQGKALRVALNQFEELYDTSEYSPERYYKWIKAPILINQGTSDPEIPFWWSEELLGILEENEIDAQLNLYPGANHNLQPSWQDAVNSTIEFYNTNLN